MGDFQKLQVWKISKELAIEVYRLTDKEMKLKNDFGLKDQMRRSAISIPSNIAEGDELDTQKQSVRHLYYAKGSCAELMTQIIICKDLKTIEDKEANILIDKCKHISSMLYKLIKARRP